MIGELADFVSRLFDADSWPARWVCGKWSEFHGWLYIISNFAIGAAYFAIPLVIFILLKTRKEEMPFKGIFWLFIIFIIACGLSHFMDILMFWYPAYRTSAVVLFFTAIVSWITVIALIKILPGALTFKSPSQLELIIQERTEELNYSNGHLKKLHNDLDEFVYSASHDLKSPVNNIEGLLRMFEEEIDAGKFPDKNIMERMHLSVSRIEKTISKLTDIAKIQRNPYDDIKVVSFADIINEVVDEHWKQLFQPDKTGVAVKTDLKVSNIEYSEIVLKSIIYNLVSNAIKYSSTERPALIKISTFIENERVAMTVEDNGMGIDLSINKDKMFTLFKRFHDHVEGAGIGLYTIKKVIEEKGGTIQVFSEVDKGTTFKIKF